MQDDLFAVTGMDHRLHERFAIDNRGERADQRFVENGVDDCPIVARALGAAANAGAWRGRVRRRAVLAQCLLSLRIGKAPASLAALSCSWRVIGRRPRTMERLLMMLPASQ